MNSFWARTNPPRKLGITRWKEATLDFIRDKKQRHIRLFIRHSRMSVLLRTIYSLLLKFSGGDHQAAICVIVLDEQRCIDEWIQYNFFLGFTHIVIYDNSDNNSMKYLEEKYVSLVTVIHFPGHPKQLEAYNHFIDKYKGIYKWGAFIDVDEFIVLHQHNNIESFLTEYCQEGALALNWLMFGGNGHLSDDGSPILQRFTMRARKVNPHVKSIVNLADASAFRNSHFPELNYGEVRSPKGQIVEGSYNPLGDYEIAVINHYFCKSAEEYDLKIRKGRVDIPAYRTQADYTEHDLNEVLDEKAWKFFRDHVPFEAWINQSKTINTNIASRSRSL